MFLNLCDTNGFDRINQFLDLISLQNKENNGIATFQKRHESSSIIHHPRCMWMFFNVYTCQVFGDYDNVQSFFHII